MERTLGGMIRWRHLVRDYERRGLLERIPNPADRRGSLVRLTEEGRVAIEAAVDLQAQAELRMLEPLSERERDQLVRLLRKLLLAAEPG